MPKNYHVQFVDRHDEVKETLTGLSKTALRESGKVVRKLLRENVPVRSNRFKNHIGSWTMINRKTGQPTLQIGFYSWQQVKKRHKKPSHANPHWIEFGTKAHEIPGGKRGNQQGRFMANSEQAFGYHVNHPGTRATHVLRNTVASNIGEIRAAQTQYLKEISDTLEKARRGIDWNDVED